MHNGNLAYLLKADGKLVRKLTHIYPAGKFQILSILKI